MVFYVGDIVELANGNGVYNSAPDSMALPRPQGFFTRYVMTAVGKGAGDYYSHNGERKPYVYVRVEGDETRQEYGGFYQERFVRVLAAGATKEQPALSTTAMSLEQARAARQLLFAAGVAPTNLRVRSRSWDNDAKYFAVDVTEANGQRTSLYSTARVNEYLATLTPEDLTPYITTKRLGNKVTVYQFRVGTLNASFLPAPDGSYWWTEADIHKVGGLVTHEGKRYRLGQNKFVPFV